MIHPEHAGVMNPDRTAGSTTFAAVFIGAPLVL